MIIVQVIILASSKDKGIPQMDDRIFLITELVSDDIDDSKIIIH